MEAVGQLTGGLAHDFNNYLGVIIGNLDLLQETGDIAPEQKKLVDASLNSALRATELTQQLLAFSRRQPLDPRRIDVNQNLNAIIGLLQPTLGETIVLKTELAPDIWPVTLDSAQLDSCIVNLATNAHDAMPDGGNLTINTRNAQLDEQYAETNPDTAPGDYVLIEVSDTGAGMPPDTVQQAATGTQEVASNIDGIQKSASETCSAATQLLGATQELTKQNELLAGQVNEFLAGIRAE